MLRGVTLLQALVVGEVNIDKDGSGLTVTLLDIEKLDPYTLSGLEKISLFYNKILLIVSSHVKDKEKFTKINTLFSKLSDLSKTIISNEHKGNKILVEGLSLEDFLDSIVKNLASTLGEYMGHMFSVMGNCNGKKDNESERVNKAVQLLYPLFRKIMDDDYPVKMKEIYRQSVSKASSVVAEAKSKEEVVSLKQGLSKPEDFLEKYYLIYKDNRPRFQKVVFWSEEIGVSQEELNVTQKLSPAKVKLS